MLELSCSQAFDHRPTDRHYDHYDYNTPRCRGVKSRGGVRCTPPGTVRVKGTARKKCSERAT